MIMKTIMSFFPVKGYFLVSKKYPRKAKTKGIKIIPINMPVDIPKHSSPVHDEGENKEKAGIIEVNPATGMPQKIKLATENKMPTIIPISTSLLII